MKLCFRFALLGLWSAASFASVFPGIASGPQEAPGTAQVAPMAGGQIGPMNQYLGTVQITCVDFTAAGTGADILDRDNTGVGEEAVRIDVTDGNHNILYTLSFQNALGTYAGGLIGTTAYTTPPVTNPITVIVTSLAGNGLPEVVDVIGQGSCGTLPLAIPTLSGVGFGLLVLTLAALAILTLRRRHQAA